MKLRSIQNRCNTQNKHDEARSELYADVFIIRRSWDVTQDSFIGNNITATGAFRTVANHDNDSEITETLRNLN